MSLAKRSAYGAGGGGEGGQKIPWLWSLMIGSLSLPSLGHLVMCDPLSLKSFRRERDLDMFGEAIGSGGGSCLLRTKVLLTSNPGMEKRVGRQGTP